MTYWHGLNSFHLASIICMEQHYSTCTVCLERTIQSFFHLLLALVGLMNMILTHCAALFSNTSPLSDSQLACITHAYLYLNIPQKNMLPHISNRLSSCNSWKKIWWTEGTAMGRFWDMSHAYPCPLHPFCCCYPSGDGVSNFDTVSCSKCGVCKERGGKEAPFFKF